MEDWEELRGRLIRYVKRKFSSRVQICELAEDIVNQAFADTWKQSDPNKRGFAYLSKVCIHIGYRCFKQWDAQAKHLEAWDAGIEFVDEADTVDEIMKCDDTDAIFTSLDVLKEIERIIVMERYYGDFSFAQIAKTHGIKLNTVLSHHRRALEKLRPVLSAWASAEKAENPYPEKGGSGTFSKHF